MNVEIGRQKLCIFLFWKKEGRAVSFLGIRKSITRHLHVQYIGFSPAHHLQFVSRNCVTNNFF
jgi:hypothetical protein